MSTSAPPGATRVERRVSLDGVKRRELFIGVGDSQHRSVQRADHPGGHGVLEAQRRSHAATGSPMRRPAELPD